MRELIVAANLFVGTYDGTYFIYNYKNELKQIDIAIIQFPPPPPNISPRKSNEVLKALLIRAFLVLLLPRSPLDTY